MLILNKIFSTNKIYQLALILSVFIVYGFKELQNAKGCLRDTRTLTNRFIF